MSKPVFALCSGISEPAQNFGARIINCPDAKPELGFVGAVGQTATVNSAGIDVICEDGAAINQQSVPCQAEAGVIGDGNITVSFDWGNLPAPNGCPNQAQVPNVGRNIFQIVCNNGAGALITTAFDIGSGGYVVDFAHPYDPGTGNFDMPMSTTQTGLQLAQFQRGGGTDQACINQTAAPARMYSDCDPGSLATAFGVTCPDTTPSLAPGPNLYTFTGPASQGPADLRVAAWGSPVATTAGPGGSKCVNFPTPAAGICTWIGATSSVGGSDTGAISGWTQVCAGDPTAATDKVKINSAAFNQGKLNVGFSTENEALIVGFNVYAGSTKLNTGLIAAKGTGSNAYAFEVGRGAVKSNKTVIVEAVKSDGSVVKTAPATVK
jgi:hypothetical protein